MGLVHQPISLQTLHNGVPVANILHSIICAKPGTELAPHRGTSTRLLYIQRETAQGRKRKGQGGKVTAGRR